MTYDKAPSYLDLSQTEEYVDAPFTGHRLVNVILFETAMVAIIGLLVLGIAWEAGYFKVGFIAAIAIWVCVSPAIEIATVRKCRRNYK